VALAAGDGAEACEIYTDVAGVLGTDPRQVAGASLMETVAATSAGVGQASGRPFSIPAPWRSLRNYGVPLVVRSSWSEAAGTRLTQRLARPIGSGGLELGKPVDWAELEGFTRPWSPSPTLADPPRRGPGPCWFESPLKRPVP